MGGAASLLSGPRATALAVLGVILVGYAAVADQLWAFSSRMSVVVIAVVVLPTFAAAIWLALPVARGHAVLLLVVAGVSALAWLVLHLVGFGSAANVAKLSCFALLGFWFLSRFRELWWVVAVAAVIPWLDAWSVAAGPTKYVVEQRPGFFERISVALPATGNRGGVEVGPSDVIFFALFLAAADRFRLRTTWTWIAMTTFLAITLVLVWELDVSGLPALPAISLGFLVPNADLISRDLRRTWRLRRQAIERTK